MKNYINYLLIVVLAIAFAACDSGVDSDPTFDGSYEGSTSEDESVSFSVNGSTISDFSSGVYDSCGFLIPVNISTIELDTNTGAFNGFLQGDGYHQEVSGEIDSSGNVTGLIRHDNEEAYCAGETTFSAFIH